MPVIASSRVSVEKVLYEIASHERVHRPGFASLMAHIAPGAPPPEVVQAYSATWRAELVRSLRNFTDWRRATFPGRLFLDRSSFDVQHLLLKLAPQRGTLSEAGETLARDPTYRDEFVPCHDAWLANTVDLRGLTAVCLRGSLWVVEGCHRLITLAWLRVEGRLEVVPRELVIFVGQP